MSGSISPMDVDDFYGDESSPEVSSLGSRIVLRHWENTTALGFYLTEETPIVLGPVVPPNREGIKSILDIPFRESREPQRFLKQYPYLGLLPSVEVLKGPIFGRFAGNRGTFRDVVANVGLNKWAVRPDLVASWIRVEQILIAIQRTLKPLPPIPVLLEAHISPSFARYYDARETRDTMVNTLLFAQKTFLYLIAQLRYAVIIAQAEFPGTLDIRSLLLKKDSRMNYDGEWLDILDQSVALKTNNIPGFLINHDNINRHYLSALKQAGIPLYILILRVDYDENNLPQVRPYSFMDSSAPRTYLVDQAVEYVEQQELSLWNHVQEYKHLKEPDFLRFKFGESGVHPLPIYSLAPPFDPSNFPFMERYSPTSNAVSDRCFMSYGLTTVNFELERLPSPFPGSGQEVGQWWYEFARERRLIRSLETLSSNQIMLETQQNAFNDVGMFSLLNQASFYTWELCSTHPDFLLRRAVTPTEAAIIWEQTNKPANRVFSVVHIEWDLYPLICNLDDMTRLSCQDIAFAHEFEDMLSDVPAPTKDLPNNAGFSHDLLWDRKEQREAQYGQERVFDNFSNIIQYAHARFGFETPIHYTYIQPLSNVRHPKYQNLLHVPDALYTGDGSLRTIENSIFFLLEPEVGRPPLIDIIRNPDYIIARNNLDLRYIPEAKFMANGKEMQGELYLLRFKEEKDMDLGFTVGLRTAADVVFLMRSQAALFKANALEFLLLNCVPFFTLLRVSEVTLRGQVDFTDIVEHPVVRLPVRYSDFADYESRREDFFDSPKGNAAAKCGGIQARLWRRNANKFNKRMQSVCRGPLDISHWSGIRVDCGGGEVYYDDWLTKAQSDFIVGTLILAGSQGGIDHTKPSFFWPQGVTFNKPLTGRWSPLEEAVFKQLEDNIVSRPSAKNVREWKKAIDRKTDAMDKVYNTKCAEFLQLYMVAPPRL